MNAPKKPTLPKLTPVSSSNINGVHYDEGSCCMTVQFASGQAYQYAGVPKSAIKDFFKAESKGAFFASKIRNAYKCTPFKDK